MFTATGWLSNSQRSEFQKKQPTVVGSWMASSSKFITNGVVSTPRWSSTSPSHKVMLI